MVFWDRLSEEQANEYLSLSQIIQPWVAWCAIKPKERGTEPRKPTDDEFIRHECLAMIGWNVTVP